MALYKREELKVFSLYSFDVSIRADVMDTTKRTNEVVIKRNSTYSMRINMQESIVDRIFKLIIGISEKLKSIYESYTEKYAYLEKAIGTDKLEQYLQTECSELDDVENPEVENIKQKLDEINNKINTLKEELSV